MLTGVGITNGLKKDIKNIIIFDVALLAVILIFVNTYKTFFLLLTGLLVTYLTYRLVGYFIDLSTQSSRPSCTDLPVQEPEDDFYEFKLANFLFRNAALIRTIKQLSRNRFVKFSIMNCPLEKTRSDSEASNKSANSKYEAEGLPAAVSRFTKRIIVAYIDRWYHPIVSTNEQFPREIAAHCETLLNDLLGRLLRMEKLKIFADGVYIVNNNFINMAIYNYLNGENAQIPLENLHPAVRNSPASEIAYLKRMVILGFRKSLPNISITEPVLEELFAHLIGKNVFQFVMDILSKPNFMWWCIGAIVDKEKAMDDFAPPETLAPYIPPAALPIARQQPAPQPTQPPPKTTTNQHRKSQSLTVQPNNSMYSYRNPVYDLENQPTGGSQNLYFQIFNIKIVDTEISVELKSGKEFTLYNIQFEYRLKDLHATRTSPELNSDCSFKKLKRRYKEFVQLQKSLEDNPQFKHFLKHIKTPAKYLVLPIGNMESEYVEKRRKRLNDYLNSLAKIPEICQSRELISFLDLDSNEYFNRSSNILNRFTEVLEKISPVGHFTKKAEELDLAIEFGQLASTSYEFTNHESYEQFYRKLNSILQKKKAQNSDKPRSPSLSNNSNQEKKKSHLSATNTHFSKQCFEIWNKTIIASSKDDGKRWINNQNIYKMIEVAICDYYVEDFFHEMFNGILSRDFMVIYLQFIETLLFEKRQRQPINFDDPKHDFKGFALKQIFDIVPKIAQMVVGEEMFRSSITLLISSLNNQLLNKHIVYSVFDLILLNIYGEDFRTEAQNI